MFFNTDSREQEIQREDETEILRDDFEAVSFVIKNAKRSVTCRHAIEFIIGLKFKT